MIMADNEILRGRAANGRYLKDFYVAVLLNKNSIVNGRHLTGGFEFIYNVF